MPLDKEIRITRWEYLGKMKLWERIKTLKILNRGKNEKKRKEKQRAKQTEKWGWNELVIWYTKGKWNK